MDSFEKRGIKAANERIRALEAELEEARRDQEIHTKGFDAAIEELELAQEALVQRDQIIKQMREALQAAYDTLNPLSLVDAPIARQCREALYAADAIAEEKPDA